MSVMACSRVCLSRPVGGGAAVNQARRGGVVVTAHARVRPHSVSAAPAGLGGVPALHARGAGRVVAVGRRGPAPLSAGLLEDAAVTSMVTSMPTEVGEVAAGLEGGIQGLYLGTLLAILVGRCILHFSSPLAGTVLEGTRSRH